MAVASTSRRDVDEQVEIETSAVLHVHEGVGDHVAALVEVEEPSAFGLRMAATTPRRRSGRRAETLVSVMKGVKRARNQTTVTRRPLAGF